MVAYQQTGNQAKMADAAQRLLQVNPNSVRALALLAYSNRAAQKWADAEKYAIQGLQALPHMQKGEGVSGHAVEKRGQLRLLLFEIGVGYPFPFLHVGQGLETLDRIFLRVGPLLSSAVAVGKKRQGAYTVGIHLQ